MQKLGFTLIEDGRFPNKPKLDTLIGEARKALGTLGSEIDWYERNRRILDWGDHKQERIDFTVEYPKFCKVKSEIISRVNDFCGAQAYRINGKSL